MLSIMDPLTGEMHHNVISLDEYRKALAPAETYADKVERLKVAILKAHGLGFVLDRDPGDERDVGC